MNISILGAGTWGIALAALLANNRHSVRVWSAIPEEIDQLNAAGVHKKAAYSLFVHKVYLPFGFGNIKFFVFFTGHPLKDA